MTRNRINFCERLALPRFNIFVKPSMRTNATASTDIVTSILKNSDIVLFKLYVPYNHCDQFFQSL